MRLSVTMISMPGPPPDGSHQDGDGERLHDHPQAHQLIRIGPAEVAAAEQSVDAEGQDDDHSGQRQRDQIAEDVHYADLISCRTCGLRPSRLWAAIPKLLVSMFSERNSSKRSNFGPTPDAFGIQTFPARIQPAASCSELRRNSTLTYGVTRSVNTFTEPC